jgi:2'-5' RNA ligase
METRDRANPLAIACVGIGMEMKRLFLGIPVDVATQRALRQWQQQQPARAGQRWVPAGNRHVTLYFFGAVPVEMMSNLQALLTLALQGQPRFDLPFEGYCLAPKASEPRMIWARYAKHPAFRALVQQVHQLYQQIDATQQIRKSPTPHVTLARLKQWDPTQSLPPGLAPPLPVTDVVLWESVATAHGSRYEAQQRWTLGR